MPSQNNASLGGFNKPVSSNPDNRTISEVRGGGSGTSAGFNKVALSRPPVFDGSASDNVASLPTGTTMRYAVNASGFSVNPHDLSILNQVKAGIKGDGFNSLGDGLNSVLSGREVLTRIVGGPLQQLRDGRWVDSSGTVVRPGSSGFDFKQIVSGSGDRAATNGRAQPGIYNYRLGLNNTRKTVTDIN